MILNKRKKFINGKIKLPIKEKSLDKKRGKHIR